MLSSQAILSVMHRRKVRITSSRHDPYELGYTRVTMATTEGSNDASRGLPSRMGCTILNILLVRLTGSATATAEQVAPRADLSGAGSIEVVVGPMFAGKTSELLRRIAVHEVPLLLT